jgi:8-oxo-dGTP pyrophosphatase MutT (NUDIX family)
MTSRSNNKISFTRALVSRLLHVYFLKRRGLTLGVRAIVRSDDEFLLVRHTYTPGWHFPGGGVEKGETVEQALNNELIQETGLKLASKPVFHGVFHNIHVSDRDHVLVYICNIKGTIRNARKNIEIAELNFFHYDKLPPDIDHGTSRRIREIVFGEEMTETW